MRPSEVFVHPSSVVPSQAQLDEGVWIGPNCVIGEKAVIGRGTRLDGNVHIADGTEIGEDCRFSPFCVIGTEPQDVGYRQEETRVKIGGRNVFREFSTVHRGTPKGGGLTSVGEDNYFMAYSHIGHDCQVGSGTVFTNAATLGGHVSVEDFATVGAFSAVHQFCRVGRYAFIGGFTVVTQDVLPFCRVGGMRPVLIYGLNAVGLLRRGFGQDRLAELRKILKIVLYSDLNTTQAVEKLLAEVAESADRDEIIRFIRSSRRGIIKKAETCDEGSES